MGGDPGPRSHAALGHAIQAQQPDGIPQSLLRAGSFPLGAAGGRVERGRRKLQSWSTTAGLDSILNLLRCLIPWARRLPAGARAGQQAKPLSISERPDRPSRVAVADLKQSSSSSNSGAKRSAFPLTIIFPGSSTNGMPLSASISMRAGLQVSGQAAPSAAVLRRPGQPVRSSNSSPSRPSTHTSPQPRTRAPDLGAVGGVQALAGDVGDLDAAAEALGQRADLLAHHLEHLAHVLQRARGPGRREGLRN